MVSITKRGVSDIANLLKSKIRIHKIDITKFIIHKNKFAFNQETFFAGFLII